ncbi:hypothetical protein MSMEG_6172 [Mycolicibacterium smegmatis MC2 155]|uniref:Uncharacterized protein n=1 Tax=Mycolicibacterium smegmatis (strain ATCC 700084 / mc(2)155) TaxID=246196 RepID=A0R5F4_MYCS2|nr:hypothetical protein MSMEG_6172 [Mycolicibacterium smegmatis MC2 155]
MAAHDTFPPFGAPDGLQETRSQISCDFRQLHVYSEHYSAYAEVYQPDPPGLIRDDLRLLPPWRGSSSFPGKIPVSANRAEIARHCRARSAGVSGEWSLPENFRSKLSTTCDLSTDCGSAVVPTYRWPSHLWHGRCEGHPDRQAKEHRRRSRGPRRSAAAWGGGPGRCRGRRRPGRGGDAVES